MPDSMSTAEMSVSPVSVVVKPDVQHREIFPVIPLSEVGNISEIRDVFVQYPFVKDALEELHTSHMTTYNHSIRTGIGLARLLDRLSADERYHFTHEEKTELIAAGLAHDWGKAYLSDITGILDYPGRLEGASLEEIRSHLSKGYRRILPKDEGVALLVAGHHIADGYNEVPIEHQQDKSLLAKQMFLAGVESTDAVMSTDRAYLKVPATPDEAYGFLRGKRFYDTRSIPDDVSRVIVSVQQGVMQQYS